MTRSDRLAGAVFWLGVVTAMGMFVVLVMGVTYKPDVNDVRESPALEIIEMLERKGAHVTYADPFTPQLILDGVKLTAVEPTADAIAAADCVLILTNHSAFVLVRLYPVTL